METIGVGSLVLALGVLAFVHEGVPAAQVDLNDGGVWITNGNKRLLGHFNYRSQTLDGGLRAATANFDVTQYGNAVLAQSPDQVWPVDTAAVALTGEAPRSGIQAAHGGSTVLFADEAKGKVWVTDVPGAGSFNPAAEATFAELDHPRVLVAVDGTGYVITAADGKVRRVRGTGTQASLEDVGSLGGELPKDTQFTTVGDTVVALDGSRVLTTGSKSDVEGLTGGVLQQPSVGSREVVVAGTKGLWRVPLHGGAPTVQEVPAGAPAAPVALGGCVYGVWAQSGYYVRSCDKPELDEARQYPELAAAKEPAFRVNRESIVINDLVTGAAYLPTQSMLKVDNWDLIEQQLKQEEDKRQSDDSEETELAQLQDFSEEQHPPVANDDEMGARAGEASTLPVLLNDVDVDGDVLTAVIKDVPQDVRVVPAKDGRAVRVEVPADKTGSFKFTYQAFDGVDLSNVATVDVKVASAGSNQAPEYVRRNGLRLSERSAIDYSVLPDWVDPDGDPIYLEKAVGADGLDVNYLPNGFISARDLGTGGPGRRTITVTVSDGRSSTTEDIVVHVSPGSSDEPPIANNDHYTAQVGEAMTFKPLANDTDPENKKLRIIELGPTAPGAEADLDPQTDTVRFVADKVGSQTLVYSITDGANKAKGKIRVDVIDPKEAADAPAAENDLALLPTNGYVTLEPLQNDFDPAGGVLVIQGVSKGSSQGVEVEVVRHSLLRITSPTGLTAPQTFEYTVSNGRKSASAKVLVVPLAAQSELSPPVALPDATVVRAGDIVTVGVMGNDYSPSELPLKMLPDLEVKSGSDLGEFFVSGDTVRFKAGDQPGTAEAIYTIQDSQGAIASSTVTVTVKDFDDRNQQPKPAPVEARTFAGKEVRVPIPMDGVDPDGDSVELVDGTGIVSPQLGSVRVEGNYLLYNSNPSAGGTDSFTYRVKDRFGAEGEGVVRIGVAPRPDTNQAPVAVPDEIVARPSTRVQLKVTNNDIDPDGDTISLVADSVEPTDARWDPQAEIKGQDVVVVTPKEKGVYLFYYSITDGGGVPVKGVASVIVDENAPLLAPVAVDDYVAVKEIIELESVDVDVLVNDSDPDGTLEDLKVTVEAPANAKGGTVNVPLTDDRQIVLYQITDGDGLSSRAAIVVPGKGQIPPMLNPATVPAKVKGGETLVIGLDDYVVTRPGHKATLTAMGSVKAGPGGDTTDPNLGLVPKDDRTITFTPDKLFIGSTSVSFEVTDGTSVDDPRGLRATLSLPIEVESSGLFPPELRPSEIKVAPGEDPIEVALAQMVNDPDPGDNEKMQYTVKSVAGTVDAKVNGQQVLVAVPANTPVGTKGGIVVGVDDGSTEPQEMTVPVTVITSTRPLMNVQEFTDKEGRVGRPTTVDLAQLITNPFADKGGQITLVGQPQVTGPASVTASGLVLTITPRDSGGGGDAAEDVVVTYTVADATLDSTRHRTGTVRVVVKDVPKSPTNVSAQYVASRTAQVSWTHTGWRGGTPKGFTVHWNGGSKDCGLQTMCVLDTLANNQTYTFTVTASVQESDIPASPPSAASNSIFVDVRPNTPAAPTAKFGDRKIDLTWPATTVPDGGSPVTKYIVEITPADTTGQTRQETSATSLSWGNLANGTAYTFTVTAHNSLTLQDNKIEPPTGPASSPEVPAGAPSNQAAPSVAKDKAVAGVEPRAVVSWAAPGNPNGDSSFNYEMRQTGTTAVLYTGSATSSAVTMAVGTEDKTFEVRSTNKSGLWSAWSPASNAVRAFQPPGAPSGFSVTPTGANNEVKMTFTAAPGNGAKPNEVTYRWNANGQSGTIASGGTVTNGSAFPNGQNVSVTLTAVSTVNGETAEGGSTSGTVNAYGPPAASSASAGRAGNGNVDLSWSSPASSNGRSITGVRISTTQNTRSGTVGLSGSTQEGTAHDQTICITVRAVNSEGQESDAVQRCATTRGSGTATVHAGPDKIACAPGVTPGVNGCRAVYVKLINWYPSSRVTCYISSTNGNDKYPVIAVDGNGYGYQDSGSTVAIDWTGWHEGEDITSGCHY